MRNINKVILIGNVARTPEVRNTAGGQKMATFVLATNRTWYDPQGQKQGQAEFHNMLAWGKIAEICEKFLQKSTLVYIEGYLKTRSWENDGGIRFYRTEVVIQDILVLDRGIRHNSSGHEDQGDQNDHDDRQDDIDYSFEGYPDEDPRSDEEKAASDIEKNFQKKLLSGNSAQADTTLFRKSSGSEAGQTAVSLDEPLFEEESK